MTPSDIETLQNTLFAPWVKELGLTLQSDLSSINQSNEPIVFSMPVTQALHRSHVSAGEKGSGVMCGQALAAASDTVSVLALVIHNNGFRECTTTDLTIRFMRPVMTDSLELHVRVLSSGKRMAVTDVEAMIPGNEKIFAKASCAFAYLSG